MFPLRDLGEGRTQTFTMLVFPSPSLCLMGTIGTAEENANLQLLEHYSRNGILAWLFGAAESIDLVSNLLLINWLYAYFK